MVENELQMLIKGIFSFIKEKYGYTDEQALIYLKGYEDCTEEHQQSLEKRDKMLRDTVAELCEAKRLLKLTIDTNYSLHKDCIDCSHFTSDRNCDIGKYLYGTGERECEWEWKHMGEIINFLHD